MKKDDVTIVQDGNGYWRVRYLAPKGFRVNRGFDSITLMQSDMWFDHIERIWKKHNECKNSCGTHHNSFDGSPRTFKAFLRYLKRHKELRGHEVTLVNRMYYHFDDGTFYDTHVVANYIEE